jgi:hypothetical protein
VDAPSETLTALLVGVAALLLVIGANGRKLASLKVGDEEVTWATSQAAKAGAKAREQARQKGMSDAKQRAAETLARADALVTARTAPSALDLDEIAGHAVAAFDDT